MAVIKILPKSIFSISNNNNIKNNKIKGVNANVSTVAYTNFEVGQGDMDYVLATSPVKEYTVISDWYKRHVHIIDVGSMIGSDLYSALRYKMTVRCCAVGDGFDTEEYIDRNFLICNGQVGNLFDSNAIWAESNKMPIIDSNSSPFSTFAIQAPTSLGTIEFERESTTITGTLSSDDMSAITTSLKEYIKNNMFFAEEFTESTTQTHITTKVFFIGNATMTFDLAQEVVAPAQTPSNYDDPTKWEYYATSGGHGVVIVFIAAAVEELVLRAEDEGFLSRSAAASVSKALLAEYLTSALAQRIAGADEVRKEIPFTQLIEAEGSVTAVQGMIDCLIREGDKYTVIDFKTDEHPDPDRYRIQLACYAESIRRTFGSEPDRIVYFMKQNQEVQL